MRLRRQLLLRIVMVGIICAMFFVVGKNDAFAGRAPTIQEMRAQQAVELEKERKTQQVFALKSQRNALMAQVKTVLQDRNESYKRLKIAERDYQTAVVKLNNAKQQEQEITAQLARLRSQPASVDTNLKIQKLKASQSEVFASLKSYQLIMDQSNQVMQAFDSQYRNLVAKLQMLRAQISTIESQIQFIIAQP